MFVSSGAREVSDLASLPGPRTPALLNIAAWALRQNDYWNTLADRYGPAFRVRFPFMFGQVAVFSTPTAARTVLRLAPASAHAGRAYKLLEQSAGASSVILLDEDAHLRMRKLILSPLHGERLARWEGFCAERTLAEIADWQPGQSVALRPVTERISLAVILRIVFGIRDPARSAELARLLPILFQIPLLVAPGYLHPLGRIDLGPRSPWGAFRRQRDRIDALILAEVAERRAEMAQRGGVGDGDSGGAGNDHDAPPADLLSMLLAQRDDSGAAMTDRELRDQLVTMLVAGHETTSTSTAWAMERLVRHPEVLERLRGELAEGRGDYLDAVIKETLRTRPVVAQIGRWLTRATEIDGVTVPAQTMVIIPMSVLHRDPEVHPDPEAFRPERFLGDDDPGGYSWLPFGGGVRRCPGASLALLEMRVIITTLVQHLDLAPDRPEPEAQAVRGITIVPSRGGRVRVTGRRVVRG